ncbi:Tetratricopeptide repeat-containing protein [Sphingomonas laterariae]|uniref:Tetratricopeptide repeat-containing protein n=1 Tax=Edaphosphingomonas laterariae TaxID=861865 RepID=A0A239CHI1_9SPHN|nr:CHAT domain-containing tetratricopeptide repeat protein [Sphingomonas laterariae]SNS19570.1 Tetratricopeptide repeat-containing protein [Sphingomonas laterariae]
MTPSRSAARRHALLLSACLIALAPLLAAPVLAQAAGGRSVDPASIPPLRAPTAAEQAQIERITAALETATAERRWADAVALGKQALAIEETTAGPDHPEVAGTQALIAGWLANQDKFAEADPYYQRSYAIFAKRLGDGHPLTMTAANNLATNYQALGRFADAQPIYQQVLDASIATYGAKHKRVALAYNNLGFNLARQGRYAEAKAYYDKALATADGAMAADDVDRALILNNVAASLDALGRPIEAEPLYRQALALRLAKLGDKDPRVAVSYNNLGYNLNAQGRYPEAGPAYRRALDIRVARDPQARATATSYNNVAHNLNRQGRYAEAAPLYARALAIWEKTYGPDHPITAIGLSNVAVNMERMGKAADAQPLFERALKIRQATLGATHPDIATGQIKLAHDLASQKKYAQAAPLYEQGVAARRSLLGPQHPALAEALTDQADMLADMGPAQRGKAVASAREAVEIVRLRRAARLSGEAAGEAGGIQQTLARVGAEDATRIDPLAGAFGSMLRAAWLRGGDAAGEAPALRAEAFTAAQDLGTSAAAQTMAQTAARFAAGSDTLAGQVRRQQDLSAKAREIDARLLDALTKGDVARANAARTELASTAASLSAANRQLRKDYPDYAELVQPGALSIAEAQARLKPDEAVLLVISSGADVYSFAVTKENAAWARADGAAPRIAKGVERLRCQVDTLTCPRSASDVDLNAGAPANSPFVAKGYPAFDRPTAYALYRDLVAPVEATLQGRRTVYVVTSGALAGLPLGLLPTAAPAPGEDGADPKILEATPWLADRYALSNLPSVSVLRAMRRSAAAGAGFIGYGAPVLDGPDKSGRGLDPNVSAFSPAGPDGIPLANPVMLRTLSPLPGTATELSAMAKTLKASAREIHLGNQATEGSVRSDPAIRKTRILAFATHGVLPGELSGLEEPGLVFTPPASPSTRDDGLLTASEVSRMSLSADFVILSACNTASTDGTPGADSLSSLARSFIYAGASALLASHWRVADDSTAALTVETLGLRQADASLSRADALKAAMAAIRTGKRADGSAVPGWTDGWTHPAAWAPFTVISGGE